MSLRDDLDTIWERLSTIDRLRLSDHHQRLRAALTPAALKWLKALPELLEAKAARVAAAKRVARSEARVEEWDAANDRLVSLFDLALHEAAALHTAASAVNAGTDNKEQK